MATTDGDAKEAILDAVAARAPSDVTVPPKGIRDTVETTAGYVARNGIQFEARIRDSQETGSRTAFLQQDSPYYAYYRWRMEDIKAGGGNIIAAGRANEVSFQGKETRKGPDKPEDFDFSARMPQLNAQDLEVIKLTALFVAKNGRSWMTTLSQREAGNPQFNFLRPQHTFYQYFSRLLDQYTDLLNGDSVDSGRPQKKRIVQLEDNVKSRPHIMERAKKRAEYVKYQEAQRAAKEEKEEKERVTYAQIDWHDFTIVETVVFDERDEHTTLAPPPSLNDLQSASLEQRAALSVDPSRRLEEGFSAFGNVNQGYDQQPAPQPTPAPVRQPQGQHQLPQFGQYHTPPPPVSAYQTPPPVQAYQQPPIDPNSRMSTLQADRERVRAAQEAARSNAPMKIRTDHIPRAQAKKVVQTTSICPNCKQAILNDEMAEHLRIEMLDPRWREQSKIAQHRSSTTNLSTADVANNLKRLASQRTDVFDPITGRTVGEPDAKRAPPPDGVNGQQQGVQNTTDVQTQIRQLHQRFGGQQQ